MEIEEALNQLKAKLDEEYETIMSAEDTLGMELLDAEYEALTRVRHMLKIYGVTEKADED